MINIKINKIYYNFSTSWVVVYIKTEFNDIKIP